MFKFFAIIFFTDALLADLQNSSRGSGNRKPSDDFPPPPGINNSHNESYKYKSKPSPPQTMSKPEPVKSQFIKNESDSNLSQKSFNNLSELEGLLQDLDRASDNYHSKSFAQSQLNIAQTSTPAPVEGTYQISCTKLKSTNDDNNTENHILDLIIPYYTNLQ